MFTITLFVNPTEIWPVGPQKEVVTIVKGGRQRTFGHVLAGDHWAGYRILLRNTRVPPYMTGFDYAVAEGASVCQVVHSRVDEGSEDGS